MLGLLIRRSHGSDGTGGRASFSGMEVNLGREYHDARHHRAKRHFHYDALDAVPARERASAGAIAAAWAIASLAFGIMLAVELAAPATSPPARQAQLQLENCP